MISRLVSIAIAGFALTGCAVGPQHTFREFTTADETSVATDASHRVILSQKPQISLLNRAVDPSIIVCAEPSPDVATALASSFGASLAMFGQGSGSLSGAQAQQIVQLAERTAMIQALRDDSYHTCEAYANGAINGTNYTLRMNRNSDLMVTMMLGEVAGGAFGRTLAASGTKANSDAEALLTELAPTMGDIQARVDKLAEADLNITKAQVDLKTAEALPQTTDEEKAARTAAVEKATAEVATSKAKREALLELLKSSAKAASKAAADGSATTTAGGIDATPSPEIAERLYRMQKEFIRRDPGQALIDACIVELSVGAEMSVQARADFERGVAKNLAELGFGRGLSPTTASGFFKVLSRYTETGLQKFCSSKLDTLAMHFYDARTELAKSELQVDVNRSYAAALEAEAMANAAASAAHEKCAAITDNDIRENCVGSLRATRKEKLKPK